MRGRLALWLLAVVPILLGVLHLGSADVAGIGAALNALGRLAGIGGLAFLLVAAVLSCRVPGFDRPFGGLTKLWRTHHWLGGVAFLLVLAHPVLLALGAAEVSTIAAARTLVPSQLDWGTVWGWGALLAMCVFLAPSFKFFGEPEYQRWRNVHRVSAVAGVAALAHTGLLARTIAEPLNAALWVLLAGAAVAAVAYRLVFSRRVGRLRYVVTDIERPANNIVELSLEPRGRALEYAPGQFVYLAPYDPALRAGYGEEHPYTLSSSPAGRLRVAIKDLGDASRAIQDIARGSEVRIEGPYGDFFRGDADASDELWIAGGIGITPFLSRVRHMALRAAGEDTLDEQDEQDEQDTPDKSGKPVKSAHLVYCVQDEARAHFRGELERLCELVVGLRLTLHFFYREGPLTHEFLSRHCPDFVGHTAYLCGPTPLMELANGILIAAGVPRNRIHSEEFTLL